MLTVEANDICIAQETVLNDNWSSPGLPNTVVGDSAPLQILRARWLTKNIGQSTPYPYTRNVITVTLRNIVPFVPYCPIPVQIQISGLDDDSLRDADVASWTNLQNGIVPRSGVVQLQPLQSLCVSSNDVNDHLHFKDQAAIGAGTAGNGRWDAKIGSVSTTPRSLTLYPARETRAGSNLVSVRVFTASATDSETTGGLYVSFQTAAGWGQETILLNYPNYTATLTLNDAPLKMRIRNSHPTDGYQFWKITLNVNQVDQQIASHPSGPSGASPSDYPFYWLDGDGPAGTMPMKEFALDWWWGYVFSMELVNPVRAQPSPDVRIRSSGICIAESSMDKDQGRPCCTTCTATGDASDGDAQPLKVMQPLFCTKSIHQSTPNPCQLNTFTVTMTANVPFMNGQTIITISGLSNADFGPEVASGVGSRSTVINISDASGGAGHHRLFGSSFSGEAGTGHWDDVEDTLTLYVLQNTESASEYTFSFQLYNPPKDQLAATPQISASFVGNSKKLFTADVRNDIPATDMTYPVTEVQNLHDPLYVIAARFTEFDVSNTSVFPCDNNTITIRFKTNVPLESRCRFFFY